MWKAVERYWPEVSAGRVTASTALARVLLYETRGTAAIASGRLPEARRLARQLGRDAHRIAAPTRDLLLAGVALALGEKATAARHYASAQGGYGRCDMQLMSWVCRRRQGQVEGGEEALVRSADGWLANEGVVDTPRLCAALAPVPADVESASG